MFSCLYKLKRWEKIWQPGYINIRQHFITWSQKKTTQKRGGKQIRYFAQQKCQSISHASEFTTNQIKNTDYIQDLHWSFSLSKSWNKTNKLKSCYTKTMVCFLVVFYTHNRCCSCVGTLLRLRYTWPTPQPAWPKMSQILFTLGLYWSVCLRLYQIQTILNTDFTAFELSYLRTPSTHSSMKVKDLVWRPSPHISNLSTEVRAFLQNAAGAFSLPPIWINPSH